MKSLEILTPEQRKTVKDAATIAELLGWMGYGSLAIAAAIRSLRYKDLETILDESRSKLCQN